MAWKIAILLSLLLPLALAEQKCGPVPKPYGAAGQKTYYHVGETYNSICLDPPYKPVKLECTKTGSWLAHGSCGSMEHHPPKKMISKHDPHKGEIMFDHYHVPGDPRKHHADTMPHYHPNTARPIVTRPVATLPTRPITVTVTPTPPPVQRPCRYIPGVIPYYQNFPQGIPAGFDIRGLRCPNVPETFTLKCDPRGSGTWLVQRYACRGALGSQG